MKKISGRNNIKVVFSFLENRKYSYIFYLLGTVFSTIILILILDNIKNVIDTVSIEKNAIKNIEIIKILGLVFIYSINEIIGTYLINYSVEGSLFRLRERLFKKIQTTKYSKLTKLSDGDIFQIIDKDIESFDVFVGDVFPNVIKNPISFLIVFVYLVNISPLMTFISLVILSLLGMVSFKLLSPLENYFMELKNASAQLMSSIKDKLSGIEVVKSYALEEEVFNDYSRDVNGLVSKFKNIIKYISLTVPLTEFAEFIPSAFVMIFGGYLVFNGSLEISTLFLFLSLLDGLSSPFNSMLEAVISYKELKVSFGRILGFLDNEDEKKQDNLISEDKKALRNSSANSDDFYSYDRKKDISFKDGDKRTQKNETIVEIKNMSFSYEEKEIFENVNISINKGEKIAIIGESGAGKSTLVDILLGLKEVSDEAVFLFGKDINSSNLDNIRENITYIQQEPFIINSSFLDNLKLGNHKATDKEIIDACKKVKMSDYIETLLNKYQTIIKEDAFNLSGGQKQRLAIARVFIKNSPLVILDEVTSSLDKELQEKINETVFRDLEDKTVIIITHNISSVENMDRILEIKNKTIVEQKRC